MAEGNGLKSAIKFGSNMLMSAVGSVLGVLLVRHTNEEGGRGRAQEVRKAKTYWATKSKDRKWP